MVGLLGTGRLTKTSLNHYCTSYTNSYGREYFQPRLGHHSGTGYSSNYRPVLYYTSSLDRYDNPQFGLSLMDSFESQSKRQYRCLVHPDGTEALTCSGVRCRESGYLQLHSQPRSRDVSCQSENQTPHRPLPVLVGRREESGYTEGTRLQPNTFLPYYINMDGERRTKESVMKTDFLPRSFLQGRPKLVSRAPQDTGFTRDTQKPLASLGISSESSRQKDRSPAVRFSIGPMCSSGFILNAPNITSLSHTPDNPQHFITHYQSKFGDSFSVNQRGSDQMKAGVQMHRPGGYSGRDDSRIKLRYHIMDSQ